MNVTATRRPQRNTPEFESGELPVGEQLTLLSTTATAARFRLSKDTRERGLRHVAEIRQLLTERADRETVSLDNVARLHDRHEHAA